MTGYTFPIWLTVCQARVNAVITNPCCKHAHLATFVSTTRAIIKL